MYVGLPLITAFKRSMIMCAAFLTTSTLVPFLYDCLNHLTASARISSWEGGNPPWASVMSDTIAFVGYTATDTKTAFIFGCREAKTY